MATGCCGVKKQKLSTAVIAPSNGVISDGSYNIRTRGGSNGQRGLLTNGSTSYSTNGQTNGMDHHDEHMSTDPVSPSSSYRSDHRGGSSIRRQPRVVCVEMVVFCFDVLYSYLHSVEHPKSPKFTNHPFPLFVTWKMGKDKKLRGCIGTFNSTSLHQGLREYAITSACKDSRFDPINTDEFARLHCSVSLLMDFEVAEHYLDWEIGIHGIRIEFCTEKGSKKAATYLPEVATEQGWNQIQTIDSLLRKGGFKGTITPEIRASICLIRFQSEKMTVSYAEYALHKQQRPYHTSPPGQKSPTFNKSRAGNNFVDRSSLPTISATSSAYKNLQSTTNGFCNRHGHCSSAHSVTANLNETNFTHSTPASGGNHSTDGYWRNESRNRQSPVEDVAMNSQHHQTTSLVNGTRYLTLPTHHTYMPPPAL